MTRISGTTWNQTIKVKKEILTDFERTGLLEYECIPFNGDFTSSNNNLPVSIIQKDNLVQPLVKAFRYNDDLKQKIFDSTQFGAVTYQTYFTSSISAITINLGIKYILCDETQCRAELLKIKMGNDQISLYAFTDEQDGHRRAIVMLEKNNESSIDTRVEIYLDEILDLSLTLSSSTIQITSTGGNKTINTNLVPGNVEITLGENQHSCYSNLLIGNGTIINDITSNIHYIEHDVVGRINFEETKLGSKTLIKHSYTYNLDLPTDENIYINGSSYKFYDVTRDKIGRLTQRVANGNVANYTYDKRGYLSTVSGNGNTTTYTYDQNGNLLTRVYTPTSGTSITSTYTYDTTYKDRLLRYNNGTDNYTLEYDSNRLFYPALIKKNNVNYCSFDYQGRRLSRYISSNYQINYYYDHQGIRIKKEISNQMTDETKTILYGYNGDKLISEKHSDYYVRYYYGLDNQVMFFEYITSGVKERYYYIWACSEIIGIVDKSGAVVVNYSYGDYGSVSYYGSKASTIGKINSIIYKGNVYDQETQLYYCNSRYYYPMLCRWLTPDSIDYLDPSSIDGTNLYLYCGNDPVNKYDGSGHFAISALIIGTIIGAAIGFGGTVLADYVDDGQIFNGSISVGSYIANTLVGGLIGGLTGGIASSSFTFTYPTLQFAQMAGANGITFGAISVGTATATISGTSIVTALGLAGITVMGVRIGKSGGYRVDHHYPNDHDPTHVHISGDDGVTRVDINGNPIQGDRPMTPGERKAFWRLIEKIIEALKPWMK